MDSGWVSPTERAISSLPLKVMSVDCTRALKLRTSSFWASKSTRKTARFLNRGSAKSFARMGFCAAQVGHQEAWISTRIDWPLLCDSWNACRVKGCSSAAKAVAKGSAAEVAPASQRRDRRLIMENAPCGFEWRAIAPRQPCVHTTVGALARLRQRLWGAAAKWEIASDHHYYR